MNENRQEMMHTEAGRDVHSIPTKLIQQLSIPITRGNPEDLKFTLSCDFQSNSRRYHKGPVIIIPRINTPFNPHDRRHPSITIHPDRIALSRPDGYNPHTLDRYCIAPLLTSNPSLPHYYRRSTSCSSITFDAYHLLTHCLESFEFAGDIR